VLTGEIKNHIDKIWDSFWSGGMANPLEVMEHITQWLQQAASLSTNGVNMNYFKYKLGHELWH
jgi:hypothetical protein